MPINSLLSPILPDENVWQLVMQEEPQCVIAVNLKLTKFII